MLGTLGMLPLTSLVDTGVMKKPSNGSPGLLDWQDTWGWDFPDRDDNHPPRAAGKAVDALLMPVRTNTYLRNGHNTGWPAYVYLPGMADYWLLWALMSSTARVSPGWQLESAPGRLQTDF